MEFANDVITIKTILTEELVNLQAAALATIFIPFHKTLNIPVINSFATETPIIVSNIGSLPDVVDDAGLLVDPLAEESIVSSMKEIDELPQIRQQLIENGKWRLKKYTWENTVANFWNSIEKIINTTPENKF